MGKNLKGRELGQGLGQRKDGLYYARCWDYRGKREERCFKTLSEAKNWRQEQLYYKLHPEQQAAAAPSVAGMTVEEWFRYWLQNIVGNRASNTLRNYRERYEHNIRPFIGEMLLRDVRPMHCQMILNNMEAAYAGSTIRQTYMTMGTFFKSAKRNGLIDKHPMDGIRYTKPVRAADDIHFLTVEEQRLFLEATRHSHNYAQYALILEICPCDR